MLFPEKFHWGAVTSAYQIEGAWQADKKGPSVWDMFTHRGGHIWEGHTGNQACDHYHRYQEDASLISEIGLNAYRFSVSWPRVMPAGTGEVNEAGLAFYDRLVDALLSEGVQPWITLFHWDFPYQLFLRGGWLNPDSPLWFAKYVAAVVDRLSDRVTHWVTLNEPQCFIGLGHGTGEHAPGLKLDLPEVLLAGHHALLAHGRAVQVIRERAKKPPIVGWSPAGSVYFPASETPADIEAARLATNSVWPGVWNNRWWGDPVVFGSYPEAGLRVYGEAAPKIGAGDMQIIQQPIDFYGCNIFHGDAVRAGADGAPILAPLPPGHPRTLYLWNQTPEALYWGAKFLAETYKLPIVITENGMSNCDIVGRDGHVHDQVRIEFMTSYLLQLRRALAEGIDVRGYFVWSLMDNFEWQEGYKHRFGLVHVDYTTQRRTLKNSALWYREVIRSNGSSLQQYVSDDEPVLPYIVREALRFAAANLDRAFNLKDLATHLHCHPDFLSRKFKQHMNEDLSAYIRRLRIDHARELLKLPDARIEDVVERSGFSDRCHFTKVFRRLVGVTPGQFQRNQKSASTPPYLPSVTGTRPRHPRSTVS